MPKSKRNKIVNLTRTKSKGREGKQNLITKVQEACENYKNIFVFHVKNMRNVVFKELRSAMQDSSKFFFGSNRVMAKALGETHEEEHRPGLRHVAKALVGDVGLLFSNLDKDGVTAAISEFSKSDFARGGGVAVRTISLPEGPVKRAMDPFDEDDLFGDGSNYYDLVGGEDALQPFPNNMESQLRNLGMPTMLKGGVILLLRDYTICTQGETLTPNQASLLKHFNLKTATFGVTLIGQWNADETEYKDFGVDKDLLGKAKNGNGGDGDVEMDEDDEEADGDE
ncbi:mRNA turnover 4 [Phlyctochytrium bullatum]|nr:mRNA turnover 4 [Phlyctochytrium bullatum]